MRLRTSVLASVLLLSACQGAVSESPSSPPPPSSPSPSSVPVLLGSTLADAKADARAVGMTAIVVHRAYSRKPIGTILDQGVRAGSVATEGDRIEVVISKFPRVPSLIGLSLTKAKERLKRLTLRVDVRRVASTAERGEVLKQNIRPRRLVPGATRIRLVVVSPHVCGAPLNPWCYSLTTGGSVIYNPALDICSYFDCIPSFWSSTNGYVIQCADGEFSHSGGVSGSCSSHGGNWRPLYR